MEHKIDGNKLILTIDISKEALAKATPSSTGKTLVVATTSGFTRLGPVSVSLNCTVPNAAFVKAKEA